MRYPSIDVLRALAILLMVQVHFVENLTSPGAADAWLYSLSIGLGMLPAPLFTFLSGVSYALWVRKQETLGRTDADIDKVTVRRGLFLFGVGVAFNVLVWLPEDTFNWDVLTLLGSGLLVLAFARKVPAAALVVLCVAVVLVSPYLRVVGDYPAYWRDHEYAYDFTLRDVLSGFVANGYFPLFPWLAFPIAGFLVGDAVFARPGGPIRWVWRTGITLTALAVLGVVLGPSVPGPIARRFLAGFTLFPASTEFVVGMLGVSLISLAMLHRWIDRATERADRGLVLTFFRRYSAYSLTVYLLHHAAHLWPLWIYGAWSHPDDPTYYWRQAMGTPLALGLAVAFLVGCSFLLVLLERRKNGGFEGLMRWVCD